jgi:two-component system sensor histidine kinase/response regulator
MKGSPDSSDNASEHAPEAVAPPADLVLLLDQIDGAILVRDAQDRVTYWSRGAEQTYGWQATEALGRQFQELLQTRFPQSPQKLAAELEEQGQWQGELTQTRKDGRAVVVASRWVARRDGAGALTGVLEYDRDITESSQVDTTLEQRNKDLERRVDERTAELAATAAHVRDDRQRFLDMLETLPVVATVIRADYRIEWVNRAYRVALGDNVGRICHQSQFGRDQPCEECQAFRPLQTGKPHRWGWTLPTGQTFDIHNFPFKASDGSPAILEVDIDVTERYRAEQQVRESEKRLALVMEGSRLGYWDWNIETGEVRRNARWAEMLGYTLAEIEASVDQWTDLHHPDDKAAAWRSITDHLEGRSPQHRMEYRMRCKNGQYKWILDQASIVERDSQGKPLRMSGTHTDIDELKRAEDALRQSEVKFANAFHVSPAALCITRISDGTFLDVNTAFLELFEFERDEVIGHTSIKLNILSPAERSRLIEAQLASGGLRNTELLAHGKNGKPVNLMFSSQPLELDGEPCHVTVMIDIGDRKRVEQALRDSEEKYRTLVEHMVQGVFIQQADGVLLDYNPATLELFGLTAEQFLRRTSLDPRWRVIHEDGTDFPGEQHPSMVALKTGRPVLGVTAGVFNPLRVDYVWLSINAIPQFRSGEDSPYQVFVTLHDITDLRRAESELITANRFLDLIVDLSPIAMWVSDREGTVISTNRSLRQTLKLDDAAIVGKYNVLKDENLELQGVMPQVKAVFEQGQPARFSIPWKALQAGIEDFTSTRDLYIDVSLIPITDERGETANVVCQWIDITARKQAELELAAYRDHLEYMVKARTAELAAAKMVAETANSAKSAFLANMSHEIRTPLNAILGLTQLMLDRPIDAEGRSRLGKIQQAGRHLLSVINDILDFSKIGAGKLVLAQSDFSPVALLDHVASLIGPQAQAKGLSVSSEADPDLGWLRGDETRLRQGLLNFAANAVKFTERGDIRLRARRVGASGGNVKLRFEVSDTGVGIASEDQARLFKSFEQLDASRTRGHGGTGLGLAITRGLAEAMGGEAGVESRPGEGSTFWFSTVLAPGREVGGQVAADIGAREALRARCIGARALVVEDNEINQEVAADLLKGAGLEVETADNGRIAVEKVEGGGFDLVLMDMQMPVLDGLEATRQIRLQPGNRTLPILAMTANAFEEDRQACMAAGMNDFVGKPLEAAVLYSAVLKWLPGGASGDEEDQSEPETSLPADQEDLLSRLQAVPGMNTNRGVAATSGRRGRYLELLRRFVSRHVGDVDRLRALLADGDRDGAGKLAHNLKGAAATLGAVDIAEMASGLNQALRAEAPGVDSGPQIDALEQALAVLGQVLGEPSPPPAEESPTLDPNQARSVLAELDDLLTRGDAQALNLLRRHRGLLRTLLGEDFDTFVLALEAFEFDKALTALRGVTDR